MPGGFQGTSPQLADKRGVPLREEGKPRIFLRWLARNWSSWVPILVSLGALGVAIHSNWISSQNSEITRKLAKLHLRPTIRLYTLFKSVGKVPPHFSITNTGPVDAIQMKIRMFSHRFSSKTQEIWSSSTYSSNDVQLDRLRPQETKAFEFSQSWLMTNARFEHPVQNNIMEIRLSYRRPQDLREYEESSFYFVNPDGLWVSEQSSSLNTELYETIKAAIFQATSQKEIVIYREWEGDKLHSND